MCAACGYVKPSASSLANAVSARRVTSANTGPRTPKDARSLSPEQYDWTENVNFNVFKNTGAYVYHSPLALTPSAIELKVHKGKEAFPLMIQDHLGFRRMIIIEMP